MMNRTEFNQLPQDVQDKIISILHVYDKAYVDYENGSYKVSPNVCLTATYAEDFKVIGTYTAEELFTEEERIENYINTFNDYPANYKGKRDYQMLRKMKERQFNEDRTEYTEWQGKLINGNFELTEQVTRKF